jgi:DNA-binding MurR/RpiR family transcriptional regulator
MPRRAKETPALAELPRDYEELVDLLVARKGTLSRRHAQLARYMLNHPEEVAVGTVVRIAGQADMPPATVTRLAQDLGFAGFPDLQRLFRERLLGPRAAYADRLPDLLTEPELDDDGLGEPARVFATLVKAATGSLVRIEQSLDRVELAAMVGVLAGAEAVHVAAARGAFGIGAYAMYGLSNVGKRAHLIDNLGAMRVEQVCAMGPRDVMLCLTFDDYTPETIEAARLCGDNGGTVVAVTDNELSPIVPLARHVLYVKEARLGHFRSQVPALVVVQSLIVSVGRHLGLDDGDVSEGAV